MVYTVALNPALDYYVYTQNFTKGQINKGIKSEMFAGGKGINVSTVLTRLGVDNTVLGLAAGFTGRELLRLLEKEGLKHDFFMLENGATRINVKVCDGEESDVNMNGDIPSEEEISRFLNKFEIAKKGDTVCLCGSVQSGLKIPVYEKICERVKQNGADIAADTTGDNLLGTLRFSPILIQPNFDELCEIYGDTVKTRDDIIMCAKDLCKKGAQNVMVTLGGDGAVLVTKSGDVLFEDGIKGNAVSTVGAGDSAFAGFIAKYGKTDIKDAFHFSMLCGAATAFKCGLCTPEDIARLNG